VFSADGDSQSARSEIARLESLTGIEFRETASRQEYVPHKVRVAYLTKGSDRQAIARCRYLQFDAGDNRTPIVPAPVPQWFTTDLVDKQLCEQYAARVRERDLSDHVRRVEARVRDLRHEIKLSRERNEGQKVVIRDLQPKVDSLSSALNQLMAENTGLATRNTKLKESHAIAEQNKLDYMSSGYYFDRGMQVP
jgi:hypothetical protein